MVNFFDLIILWHAISKNRSRDGVHTVSKNATTTASFSTKSNFFQKFPKPLFQSRVGCGFICGDN